MTLTLAVRDRSRLDNGAPAELVLHRRGAIVGRAPTCDWPLPDPTRHVSSRHFEIRFDGRRYLLIDSSTNGTVLAATGQRLAEPHAIADGDCFQVGPYTLVARLTGEAGTAPDAKIGETPPQEWQGWGPAPVASGEPTSDWGGASAGWGAPAPQPDTGSRWQPQIAPSLSRPEPHSAASGWEDRPSPSAMPSGSGWTPTAAMAPPPTPSTWESAPPMPDPASGWSSAAPDRPPAASPDDLWGRIAEGNVVDWARGGFGQPVEARSDPLGLAPSSGAASLPASPPPRPPEQTQAPWTTAQPENGSAPSSPISAPPPAPPAAPPPRQAEGEDAFLKALGLDTTTPGEDAALMARAGALVRDLVAGLVVMMEARARAKAQLGAEATAFNPDGHNPLKFARTPDEALAMLLGTPPPGFMPAHRAVEDAFRDLQSHQVATLRAMQGALRATLERFAPSAIRARADAGGMIERIVPAARDAALWQAYEREFGGVAQGSDEAFLDTFAKEFRNAYNEQARQAR